MRERDSPPTLRCFQLGLFVADVFSQLGNAIEQHGFSHSPQPQKHLAFFGTSEPHAPQRQFSILKKR